MAPLQGCSVGCASKAGTAPRTASEQFGLTAAPCWLRTWFRTPLVDVDQRPLVEALSLGRRPLPGRVARRSFAQASGRSVDAADADAQGDAVAGGDGQNIADLCDSSSAGRGFGRDTRPRPPGWAHSGVPRAGDHPGRQRPWWRRRSSGPRPRLAGAGRQQTLGR